MINQLAGGWCWFAEPSIFDESIQPQSEFGSNVPDEWISLGCLQLNCRLEPTTGLLQRLQAEGDLSSNNTLPAYMMCHSSNLGGLGKRISSQC